LSVPTHVSYGRYIQLVSGNRTLGHGEQMFFSGWMLCSNHSGAPPTATSYSAGGITVVQQPGDRMRTLAATRLAPAVGVSTGWAGKWLAFGMVPELPVGTRQDGGWGAADASANAFQALLHTPADLYSQRPRGLLLRAGSTRAQEDFGACKGSLAVTVGDPRYLHEAGHSIYDAFARPFHNREVDGTPLLAQNHPALRTWSQLVHCPTTGDTLGLQCPLPYSWPSDGYSGLDDQHRSQNNFD